MPETRLSHPKRKRAHLAATGSSAASRNRIAAISHRAQHLRKRHPTWTWQDALRAAASQLSN